MDPKQEAWEMSMRLRIAMCPVYTIVHVYFPNMSESLKVFYAELV